MNFATNPDLGTMLSEECWFDGVHPTGKGAELFSDWFAGKLMLILSVSAGKQR